MDHASLYFFIINFNYIGVGKSQFVKLSGCRTWRTIALKMTLIFDKLAVISAIFPKMPTFFS